MSISFHLTYDRISRLINDRDPDVLEYLKTSSSDLEFTVEEFEILNDVELDVKWTEYDAITNENYKLLLYLAKHYQLKCNLNGTLDTGNIVTIYEPNADYDTMIEKGYMPYPLVITYKNVIELYKGGYSDEEIKFLTGYKRDVYSYLSSFRLWCMVSRAYLERKARKGYSFPMLFFNIDMLYSSMRPKTDMSMYQTCNSNYYTELPEGNFVPVTRYGKGMSRGLYHEGDRPEDICGFFYYMELESTTYLSYNTKLVSFNKTTAARELLPRLTGKLKHKLEKRLIGVTRNSADVDKHISGELPKNLRMTFKEYQKYNPKSPNSETEFYIGHIHNSLYTGEDGLDQPLCKAARYLGYDIVVLTNIENAYAFSERGAKHRVRLVHIKLSQKCWIQEMTVIVIYGLNGNYCSIIIHTLCRVVYLYFGIW